MPTKPEDVRTSLKPSAFMIYIFRPCVLAFYLWVDRHFDCAPSSTRSVTPFSPFRTKRPFCMSLSLLLPHLPCMLSPFLLPPLRPLCSLGLSFTPAIMDDMTSSERILSRPLANHLLNDRLISERAKYPRISILHSG